MGFLSDGRGGALVSGRDFPGGARLTLLPPASGSREVAAGVWQRERQRGWGAYSGSGGLTTRKEPGEAAGAEPRAQAGQPRRGWAGAARPGTLIALGAWERPQRRGGGEANDPGSTEGPLPTQGRQPKPGMHGLPARLRGGRPQDVHSGLFAPRRGKAARDTLLPSPPLPLGSPALR